MLNKVHEGTYRDVFKANDEFYIKKLKKSKYKNIFGIKIKVSTKLYTLVNSLTLNINIVDFENYKKVKKIIPDNVPSISYLDENGNLVQEIVKNYDGTKSFNLYECNSKISYNDWEKFKAIVFKLLDNGLELMDLQGLNVLVQEYEKGKIKFILFDFKRVGRRSYPFQIDLIFKKNRAKKVRRKLNRLEKRLIEKGILVK